MDLKFWIPIIMSCCGIIFTAGGYWKLTTNHLHEIKETLDKMENDLKNLVIEFTDYKRRVQNLEEWKDDIREMK